MISKKWLNVAAVAAVASAAIVTSVGVSPADAATHTVAFGIDLPPKQMNSSGVTNVEQKYGRKLAFTRVYSKWDSSYPATYMNWLGSHGTEPVISVKAKRNNGSNVPWGQIAAANPGSALYNQMKTWADKLKSYGRPVMFDFMHEPEASTRNNLGTSSDFVAAWRKFHNVFVAEHATNVKFIWIMTDYAFRVSSGDRRYAAKWYPGDAYVNAIAADAYNWGTCRGGDGGWQSLATAISGFVKFGAQHSSKSMYLTEVGSPEDPHQAGRKAKWIADMEALFKQSAYSQIAGVSYYDDTQPGLPACNFPPTSSSSATTAFKHFAQDGAYSASVLR